MNQIPAIYSTTIPQPAQMYTSGVPGVPPTISVSTANEDMSNFISGSGPRVMRNTTAKKRVAFGGSQPNESSGTTDPGVKITVIKGT